MRTTSPVFKENARRALVDAGLQKPFARGEPRFEAKRTAVAMGPPEFERSCDIGREIKHHTLAHLDFHVQQHAETVERAGGTVVARCPGAARPTARATVLEICRKASARTVTEGKSMIGEEVAIDGRLERRGIAPLPAPEGDTFMACYARRRRGRA